MIIDEEKILCETALPLKPMKQGTNDPVQRTAVDYIFTLLKDPRVIFLASLVLRLAYISFLKNGFYFSDFRAYDRAAHSLMEGNGFDAEYGRPPLYAFFLAANYLMFGGSILSIRIVQALLGAGCTVLLLSITSRIINKQAGVIAAWISIFYPFNIFIVGLLYPTLLASLLLMSALYLVLRAHEEGSYLYAGLAAVMLGAAALAVPACLTFLPFLTLWFLFVSQFSWRKKIVFSLVCTLVVVLTLTPWTYYCYKQYDRFVLIDARAAKHFPKIGDKENYSEENSNLGGAVAGMILDNPLQFFSNMSHEFLQFWTFIPTRVTTKSQEYRESVHKKDERMVTNLDFASGFYSWVSILSYGPVFFLSLAGLFLWRKRWRLLSLPFLLIISHALTYSLFFSQVRYRLPVEFCLMIFAAGAIDILYRSIHSSDKTKQVQSGLT